MMQERCGELMNILKGFRVATETNDWDQVRALDASFREQVSLAVSAIETEVDRQCLTRFLERAQSIYELVKAGAEKNKAQIAEELTQLAKDQKAVASYQKSMQLR